MIIIRIYWVIYLFVLKSNRILNSKGKRKTVAENNNSNYRR